MRVFSASFTPVCLSALPCLYIVLELMPLLTAILTDQMDAGKCNEKHLMDPSNFGKVCVALDEFIAADGVVEHTDLDTISKLAKLRTAA